MPTSEAGLGHNVLQKELPVVTGTSEEAGVTERKQAEADGGNPEPQRGSELGSEITCRFPLFGPWLAPNTKGGFLRAHHSSTAMHKHQHCAIHRPWAPQPPVTTFPSRTMRTHTQTGRLRPAPSPRGWGHHPFLLATAVDNPSATHRDAKTPRAGGMRVGWMDVAHDVRTAGGRWARRAHAVEMRWVARVDDGGEESAFLPANPQKAGLTSTEGMDPVRLCRKWQSPGRRPPGEDTRDYAPRHLPGRLGQGRDRRSRWLHRVAAERMLGGRVLRKGMRPCPAWTHGTEKPLRSSKSQQQQLPLSIPCSL